MGWLLSSRPLRRRRARRKARDHQARLRFEALEPRRLLAELGLSYQAWLDDGDGVFDEAKDLEVLARPAPFEVEDTIWIRLMVEDINLDDGRTPAGAISLPVDFAWTDANETIIEFTGDDPPVSPDTIPSANQILTKSFPLQRFVDFFEPGATNDEDGVMEVEGLRGGSLPNANPDPLPDPANPPFGLAIGAGAPEEFSLLKFEATGPGEVTFQAAVLAGSMSFADAAELEEVISTPLTITIEPPQRECSLSGFVYVDKDNDGERKVDDYGVPLEMGLPNVLIGLYDAEDTLLATTTTGPGGRYHFEGLEPGTYEIREEQPVCFHDGKDGLDPDTPGIVWTGDVWEPRGVAGDDRFFDIELAPGEHGVEYNFGELGLKARCINKRMFVASTPSAKEPVAERLGVPTETVLGTDGDDTIEFASDLVAGEPAMVVTVNGDEHVYPISKTRMLVIDAKGGNDTATLTLTNANEKPYMLPGYATLRRETIDGIHRDWDYGVEVVHAETIDVIDNAPGGNLTVIRDSAKNDTLTVDKSSAALAPDGLQRQVQALALKSLDHVMAISVSGNDKVKEIAPPDFFLELIGPWEDL